MPHFHEKFAIISASQRITHNGFGTIWVKSGAGKKDVICLCEHIHYVSKHFNIVRIGDLTIFKENGAESSKFKGKAIGYIAVCAFIIW